jgi:GNAT superfamily N-acetyltransferase
MATFFSEVPRTEEVDEELLIARAKDENEHLERSGLSASFVAKDGRNFRMLVRKCADLTPEDRDRTFQLFEANMKSIYERTWGWKPIDKKRELFHVDTRFVYVVEDKIADEGGVEDVGNVRSGISPFIAFAAFRFDWDDEDEPEHPVLFCYELQVDERFRGLNIGAKVEFAAFKTVLLLFVIPIDHL